MVWLVLAVTGLLWWLDRLRAKHKQQKAEREAQRAQERADAAEWSEYRAARDAIRAKYDPEHKWNEATSTPDEYHDEIEELNELHSAMLKRRFGDDA